MSLKDKKGQVAVEFVFMFVICASLLIYVFYFAISLATLQNREYGAFMVGRSITSSSQNDTTKKANAAKTLAMYNGTTSSGYSIVSKLTCDLDQSNGFRDILNYGAGAGYDVVSTTGIACSVTMPFVLPLGKPLNVAIEAMTGSEITNDHCSCALDFKRGWKNCFSSGGLERSYIDNGC
jgi:Flp pilus assembly protein TadG